jgi:nucleobase:cation symporter-1, NCS1 family
MLIAAIYVLFFAPSDFFTQFQGFIVTLGVPVAAWAGIMIADVILRKRSYDEPALFTSAGLYGRVRLPSMALLIIGTVVGFGFVVNTYAGWLNWQGYLMGLIGGKTGDWAGANIGVVASLLIGLVGYLLLQRRRVGIQEGRVTVQR